MRIARYRHQGQIYLGVLEGDQLFTPYGTLWQSLSRGRLVARLGDVELLAPLIPGKLVCVAYNYHEHLAASGTVPSEPQLFLKPPSSVVGPNAAILYPSFTDDLHFEGELALVIGRQARRVREGEALDYVFGYTCANDVTARDVGRRDGQWARSKGHDTFCPLGPWLVTGLDPSCLRIQTRVNGETRQDASTDSLVFSLPTLLSYITESITLEPGDVVLTGTPAGEGPLAVGDRVEVTIEGIGMLRNTVVRGE